MLAHPPESMRRFAQRYVAERDTALRTLSAIDAMLRTASRDSASLRNAGNRVSALLWADGHPVGGYMARRIKDTFGTDSIVAALYTPLMFIRMYNQAERAHGTTLPFSPSTEALLEWEERRN